MDRRVRVDLHLHTTASDGRWTPERLIAEVQRADIGLFAVTDHDSLGSLTETAERVRGSGLRLLLGIELSARLDGQLYHLLAYGFDSTEPELTAFVAANGARLASASDDAVQMLAEAGNPISLDDYAAYTWERGRGGWKSLNFLIDQGICQDVRAYFDKVFVGELAHPQPEFPSPEEVIAVARRAGGVVILAHPGAFFYNGLDEHHLDQLVEMGIEGVECYSFHHDDATTRRLLDDCRRRNLLITGGSDCHGGFVGRPLGMPPIQVDDLRLGVLAERVIT
jgi:predicted metal-dependent phosphoesterase TrpH